MRFTHVSLPAADPVALSEWYGSVFKTPTRTVDTETGPKPAVSLGETTLQFVAADDPPPAHLAVRLHLAGDDAVDWLVDKVPICPVEGHQSRWFEFLDATAVYFEDPAGNVLEGLCYAGDPRPADSDVDTLTSPVDGITEVGLPAHETLALVDWFEQTVGIDAWGTPSETFGWVGDRHARFVVVPAGRNWYPTERVGAIAPISVAVSDDTAARGRHAHPTLPYEIEILDAK